MPISNVEQFSRSRENFLFSKLDKILPDKSTPIHVLQRVKSALLSAAYQLLLIMIEKSSAYERAFFKDQPSPTMPCDLAKQIRAHYCTTVSKRILRL